MLWKIPPNLEALNSTSKNTLVDTLGIVFTEVGDNFIIASMPVNQNTVQPFRILHGGASVALAESLGSVASVLCLDDLATQQAVGVEINANHLSSAMEGSVVFGKVMPLRIGRTLHVWNIEITDAAQKLICVSRLTVAITTRKQSK